MVVDHHLQHGSRHMIDHHRDMRLDIDDMTYEVHFTKHSSLFKPYIVKSLVTDIYIYIYLK